jgi:hypothetical protein
MFRPEIKFAAIYMADPKNIAGKPNPAFKIVKRG